MKTRTPMTKNIKLDERRRFERLAIPSEADVKVYTESGDLIGKMTVLGRGGMSIKTKNKFKLGDIHTLVIHDTSEGIRRTVKAIVRDTTAPLIGLEFNELDPDAAVEIGVIIGKYYSAPHGKSS